MKFKLFAEKLRLFAAAIFILGFFLIPGGPVAKSAQARTINVCLVILNENGDVVPGNEISGTTFVVPGRTAREDDPLPESTFTAPLNYDKDFLQDVSGNDTECKQLTNLPDNTHNYAPAVVNPANIGLDVKYNDQNTSKVKSLNDFFPYLAHKRFKEGNKQHNGNSDGVISGDSTRTLVVKIQYKAPILGKKLVKVEVAENSTFTGSNVKVLNTPFTLDINNTSVLSDYRFADNKPGKKFVWVRYSASDNSTEVVGPVAIELVLGDPVITSLGCNRVNDTEVSMVIVGNNFGSAPGILESNGAQLSVDPSNWTQDERGKGTIKATISDAQDLTKCHAKVVRFDSKIAELEGSIDRSQLSLGTKYICPVIAQRGQSNVSMEVFDRDGKSIHSQTVQIDEDGNIMGLGLKLTEGQNYTASLRAPRGLKKYASFKASNVVGNTKVLQLNLPIGDLYPASGDGAINQFDFSILKQQWGVERTATKSADFNGDKKVNSIDYSCALTSYGADDPVPDWANIVYEDDERVCAQVISYAINPQTSACQQFPSPCNIPTGWTSVDSCSSPSPAPTVEPTSTPSPTPTPSPSPTPEVTVSPSPTPSI